MTYLSLGGGKVDLPMSENEIMLLIIQALKERNKKQFQEIIEELHPYDLATQYQQLPNKHRNAFLIFLTTEQAVLLMEELEQEDQLNVLQKLGIEKSTEVLDMMENDDVTSFLAELKPAQVADMISEMREEESEVVQDMMSYPSQSAGRIMNNRYVWIPNHYTLAEAIDKLKHFAEIAEYLNYLYVIDNSKRLVGVVSYKDLILGDEKEKVEDVMFRRVLKANVYENQETVAKLISRYNFVTLPIVEEDDKLVGVVTVDDVIDIVIQEADEDIVKLSASGKAIDFRTNPFVAASRRLPWLVLLLFIGLVSGGIISRFESTLEAVVALAFFMPMIAGMTGNTGTQSLAVVVRGLAYEDLDFKAASRLVMRELWVGVLIGITCSILITMIAYLWRGSLMLGLVVGSSLLLTLIIGTLAGTIIPLILYRFRVDPAVASGPLITTINDILSLLIYFGIATMFISKLTGF